MKGLDIQKNRIAVIGFGISGISVTKYFLTQNIQVDVFEDKKSADFNQELLQEFKDNKNFTIYFSDSQSSPDVTLYDFVVASPGVSLSHTLVQQAQSNNIEYVTDINIFLRIFRASYPGGTVISVTGSNGKSTTVSMLHVALLAGNQDAYLGGNIGTSPLDFFNQIKTDKPVIILETSSYQLEYMKSPDYFDIACILNLSDNHLNRYAGRKELYAQAKLGGIDLNRTQVILNLDDLYTQKYLLPHVQSKHVLGIQFEYVENTNVITLENETIVYKDTVGNSQEYITNVKKMKLRGLHNIYNCAFICGILHTLEIEPNEKIQNSIYDFGGLIHRVQYVATHNGVVYINDSKSTSPDATLKALETIGVEKNIILISGGNDKDISYESMASAWFDYVKALVLLPGTANEKLKTLAQQNNVELLGEVATMQEAFDIIQTHVSSGDTVLLSPATDSHASFKSFEDRGNQFIACVQNSKS